MATLSGIPLPPRTGRRKTIRRSGLGTSIGRRTRHRRPPGRHLLLSVVLVAFAAIIFGLLTSYIPNFTRVPVTSLPDGKYKVVIGGNRIDYGAIVTIDGGVLLPFDAIQRFLDPYIFWDEPTKSVIVTTRDKVIKMGSETLTAYVNTKPVDLKMPVALLEGKPYVPMEVLLPVYKAGLSVHEESMTVILDTAPYLSGVKEATVKDTRWPWRRGTVLRETPSIKGRIVTDLEPKETVLVFLESPLPGSTHTAHTAWVKARTDTGFLGYVRQTDLEIKDTPRLSKLIPRYEDESQGGKAPSPKKPSIVPLEASFKSKNPISLAWDYVSRYTPRYQPPKIDSAYFAASERSAFKPVYEPHRQWPSGINVVSPTWFSLSSEGGVNSLADAFYVMDAHDHGIEVWPLVSNGFDPDLSRRVLRSADSRQEVIRELLVLAELYGFDGYNLDFENVYYEDRPLLTQFVREFAPLAREQGLKISVDVTVKSSSPNWSMCYDRRGLAQAVDYVILMAYDQYPASSKEAGPVAAIPWVERSIVRTLEEVPASKLVLGMPFYVRLWTKKDDPNGKSAETLSSKAFSMKRINETLKAHGVKPEYDEVTGLPVANFSNEEGNNVVWIENNDTVRTRIGLAKRYDLAGIAIWRMGFEGNDTWEVVKQEVSSDTIDTVAQSVDNSRSSRTSSNNNSKFSPFS